MKGGSTEAFLTKFDVSGSLLAYSTHLGGSAEDGIEGLAVDAAGQASVSGWTWSTDFPRVDLIQLDTSRQRRCLRGAIQSIGNSSRVFHILGW